MTVYLGFFSLYIIPLALWIPAFGAFQKLESRTYWRDYSKDEEKIVIPAQGVCPLTWESSEPVEVSFININAMKTPSELRFKMQLLRS